jgi:hypothetical protein
MYRYRGIRFGYEHGEECSRTKALDEERVMSEERRPVHPQESAEGDPEDVEAPGVEKAGDPSNPATTDAVREEERSAHPEEPAEGGEDEEDAPGADRPDSAA